MKKLGKLVLISMFLVFGLMLNPPALALSYNNFHVSFVKDVFGYGKYIERLNQYERGEEVKIYAGIESINVGRAYAIDFVAIIIDPDGYVVAGKVISKRHIGYEDRTYAVFTFNIPNEWKYGKYEVDVYAFDVLNVTATKENYRNLYKDILYNGEFDLKVHTKVRKDSEYVKKKLYFYVKRDVILPKSIIVFDSHLKAKVLPKDVNNSLAFTILNTLKSAQTVNARLYIDGELFSEKKVELYEGKAEQIEFSIPPLEIGEHSIGIAVIANEGVYYSKLLPIFIPPLLYDKPIKIAKYGEGFLVYSPNNYILGSIGISDSTDIADIEGALDIFESKEYNLNRDNSAKMLTNILAYVWKEKHGNGTIDIALLNRGDKRANIVLPKLLEYIKRISNAPINYIGTVNSNPRELENVDVLFYVTSNPKLDEEIKDYIKNGGIVIIDNPNYWTTLSENIKREFNLKRDDKIYTAFFDLNINKTVSIKLKTELKLPPKLKYYDLSISDFVVDVGKAVNISFKVKNEGGAGKENVTVFINGEPVYNVQMEFSVGEVKSLSFTYIPKDEGSYKVTLDKSDVSKVFFAKKAKEVSVTPTPEQLKERKGGEIIVGLAGLLALLIMIRIYLKR